MVFLLAFYLFYKYHLSFVKYKNKAVIVCHRKHLLLERVLGSP